MQYDMRCKLCGKKLKVFYIRGKFCSLKCKYDYFFNKTRVL